jgi:hypothetical protein
VITKPSIIFVEPQMSPLRILAMIAVGVWLVATSMYWAFTAH